MLKKVDNMLVDFDFRGEKFVFDEERNVIIADKGEEILYESIESFCSDAEAEGELGAFGLSGWEN